MKHLYLLTLALFLSLISTAQIPAAITGPSSICVGSTSAYADATPGGVWMSSTVAVGTVGSTTGLLTGVAAGVLTLTYALPAPAGYTTMSVTVNPLPAPITGPSAVCVGSTITITDLSAGGAWSSSSPAVATVGAPSTVGGVTPGTATISYVLAATGCVTTHIVTVNGLATAFTVTGGGSYCAGGTGIAVGLSGSSAGVTYQLMDGGAAVGSPVAGTGVAISFGMMTAAGVYTVVATSTGTGCMADMTGSVSVTVTPVVTPMVSISCSPSTSVCSGTSVSFSASPTSGGASPTYSWLVNGVASGSGATYSYTPANGDIVFVSMTSSATCITAPTVISNSDTMAVHSPVVAASSSAAACDGSYTLTATGGATYSWAPATGLSCTGCASPGITPASTTTYSVTGTDSYGCSNMATVTVDGNRIMGTVSPSVAGTIRVWLIQFNPADSSIIALDSTTTCTSGGSQYYQFADPTPGNYLVKAYLLGGTPGTSGYIPTYSASDAHWYTAASDAHASATDNMNISMIYGTVPAGPGFISGYVASGAGKGTSGDVPAAGMLIYLENASGTIITYTYTDASGDYSFSGISNGNYIIYPETYQYFTTPSSVITLSSTNETITNVDFKQHTTSMTITPYDYAAGVKALNANSGFVLYPNPATDMLNITWQNQAAGQCDVTITDIAGHTVIHRSIYVNNATGNTAADVSALEAGVYLVTVQTQNSIYNSKLVIAR